MGDEVGRELKVNAIEADEVARREVGGSAEEDELDIVAEAGEPVAVALEEGIEGEGADGCSSNQYISQDTPETHPEEVEEDDGRERGLDAKGEDQQCGNCDSSAEVQSVGGWDGIAGWMSCGGLSEKQADGQKEKAGGEAGYVGDVESGLDWSEEEAVDEKDGFGEVVPGTWDEGGQRDQCCDVEGGADEDEELGGDGPREEGQREEGNDGGRGIDGVDAGGVEVNGAKRRSGVVPLGKKGVGVVGVLVLQPETGGDVGGRKVIDVTAAGAEGAAEGELGCSGEDCQPNEKGEPPGSGG